jgi:uncharacterized protein YcbK (DUF882 family)
MNLSRGGKIFFAHRELACPATGKVILNDEFAARLVQLRRDFNAPMTLTSACRSASHNAAIGGHRKSLHVYDHPAHDTGGTAAVDVAWPADRVRFLRCALANGFSVGVARGFIHIDLREVVDMPQMCFGYGG